MSTASSPAKVMLLGEHFVVHGAKSVLCAIDKKVHVITKPIENRQIRINSDVSQHALDIDSTPGRILELAPLEFMARKLISEFNHVGGLEITIQSDIPPGVGLGSSSACCVAAAGSVSRVFTNYTREKILELAIESERTMFKDASGADSTACMYGGIIEYTKTGFEEIRTDYNPIFVVANSMQAHSTSSMVSRVREFQEKNPETFVSLCDKVSELVEHSRHAIMANDLVSVGNSMKKNQEYLEYIGVSNDKLHSMINVANKTSYGSKITGAGGGGCIVSLVDNDCLDATLGNLRDAGYDCFSARVDFAGLDTF